MNVLKPSPAKIYENSSDPVDGGGQMAPALWKSICSWSDVSVLRAEPDVKKLSSKEKPLFQL